MSVPGDVVMSKLTRLSRRSLVVNVPVAVPPSSNVTPSSVKTMSARASTAPRARASMAAARRLVPDPAIRHMRKPLM